MLNTPLTKSLLRTTDKYIDALSKWWVKTVWDLINHYPREFDDRTEVLDSFAMLNLKEKNTVLVTLVSVVNQKTASNKLLTKAIFEDKDWFMAEWVWFNRKFLAQTLSPKQNSKVLVSWKVKYAFWKATFQSPEVETDMSKVWWEVLPIYSDINYIPSKWIASKMTFLKKFFWAIEETLPDEIILKYGFVDKKTALYKLHFPSNPNDIEIAKHRLAYDELYDIQYFAISKKYDNISASNKNTFSIQMNPEFIKEILQKLPFELTDKQKIVLFQLLKDMENTHAMSRLLEWDVWTWKTIVALISAIHAIKESAKDWNKIQVAIMAPTAILATQHFEWMQELLMDYGITSNLLVWATTAKNKRIIKEDLKNGQLDLIIWTHALIEDSVEFNNLWYVVIDEQHRFWVNQRDSLEKKFKLEKGDNSLKFPHVLNMTATPIPRTLALTLYWDQDLSVINEYPKWRKEIFTKVCRTEDQRQQVELFIRSELEKWRQVFWISPLVEASEKMDLSNAIDTFESLTDIFHPYSVWLVHGKMKPKDKDDIMDKFARNEIQVLSSTSVVEVWINVPNATIMCIEWAERFGLSQLHQFRWRVWRGKYQSYCYLFPTTWNKTDRLSAMEKTNNGFELSEIDLEIRWPWEVYWVRQSWLPDLKLADLKDLEMLSQIREDIEELFNSKKT